MWKQSKMAFDKAQLSLVLPSLLQTPALHFQQLQHLLLVHGSVFLNVRLLLLSLDT